ncbi:hypothetical protein FJ471_13290 [Mesorhizobium sp. B2-7-1]|nr:hypothetical protein FJ471_13290 [Mesorhizobium sp. B2-7-1]
MRPACNAGFLRFRCSRTSSTLRSGSRKPPFSTRPDLNLNTPGACRVDVYTALQQTLRRLQNSR